MTSKVLGTHSKSRCNELDTQRVLIAKVSSAFGIKGEVKIIIYSDNPDNIEKYPLFDEKGHALKLKISNKNKAIIGNSFGNPIAIVKIDGINDRNAAEQLHGQEIFANRADFEETNEDEFYYVDLIGLAVIDMNSKKIGKVANVLNQGAGGIIEIEFDEIDAQKNRGKIDNFSFKNEFFPEVNLQKGFIRFDMPEIIEDADL